MLLWADYLQQETELTFPQKHEGNFGTWLNFKSLDIIIYLSDKWFWNITENKLVDVRSDVSFELKWLTSSSLNYILLTK